MPYGIDVSNVNGKVNWASVPKSVEFAHVKASEGVSFSDSNFLSNLVGAKKAGLHVGAYHFGRPDHHPSVSGAVEEARFFASRLTAGGWDMRPVLDLEVGSGSLTTWAGTFLAEVERLTGVRPLLYTYRAFAQAHLALNALAGYGLWIADYGRNDGRDHGTSVANVEHQFTSQAVVSGVLSHVDENFAASLEPLLSVTPKPAPPKKTTKPIKKPVAAPVAVPAGEPKNGSPFRRAVWPVPLPAWFWTWAQWRKDGKSYARPASAPRVVPPWAFARLRTL
jgi:lysozyme